MFLVMPEKSLETLEGLAVRQVFGPFDLDTAQKMAQTRADSSGDPHMVVWIQTLKQPMEMKRYAEAKVTKAGYKVDSRSSTSGRKRGRPRLQQHTEQAPETALRGSISAEPQGS